MLITTLCNKLSWNGLKNAIADLTLGEIEWTNYDISHRKINNEIEDLETITNVMVQPKEGNIEQHWRDTRAYQSQLTEDRCAYFTMLGSMHHDNSFGILSITPLPNMGNWLNAYGGISETRLRAMIPKFETCMMDSKHIMAEHLKVM